MKISLGFVTLLVVAAAFVCIEAKKADVNANADVSLGSNGNGNGQSHGNGNGNGNGKKNKGSPEKVKTEKTKKPKPTKPTKPTKATKATKPPKGATTTAAARAADAGPGTTTQAPKNGKVNCGVCTEPGKDCKPTSYDKNVDFCCKITGTVEDPNKVPGAFFSLLQFAGMGDVKSQMEKHKGEECTIRKGCPLALVALSGQKFNSEGCHDFPGSFLGMKGVTACMCKGDCA